MRARDTVRAAILGSALLVASGAGAADLGLTTAPASWAGPYAGLFAGYAWGRADAGSAFDANTGFFYNWTGNPYAADAGGFFGGAMLGLNGQAGALVYGLEGEIGYLGLSGSAVDPNFPPGGIHVPDTVTRLRSDLYAGLYARAGIATGPVLLYAKGGLALLNARASTIDPCGDGTPPCGTGTLSMGGRKLMAGWSVGGGAEWMLSPHWSARAEYAYFDFGSLQTSGTSNVPGEVYRQTVSVRAHTLKLGWSYRFSP